MSSKQKSAHVNIIYAAKAQAEKAKILNEGMAMFCYLLPSGLFGYSSPVNRLGTCVQFNCKARQTIKKAGGGGLLSCNVYSYGSLCVHVFFFSMYDIFFCVFWLFRFIVLLIGCNGIEPEPKSSLLGRHQIEQTNVISVEMNNSNRFFVLFLPSSQFLPV